MKDSCAESIIYQLFTIFFFFLAMYLIAILISKSCNTFRPCHHQRSSSQVSVLISNLAIVIIRRIYISIQLFVFIQACKDIVIMRLSEVFLMNVISFTRLLSRFDDSLLRNSNFKFFHRLRYNRIQLSNILHVYLKCVCRKLKISNKMIRVQIV